MATRFRVLLSKLLPFKRGSPRDRVSGEILKLTFWAELSLLKPGKIENKQFVRHLYGETQKTSFKLLKLIVVLCCLKKKKKQFEKEKKKKRELGLNWTVRQHFGWVVFFCSPWCDWKPKTQSGLWSRLQAGWKNPSSKDMRSISLLASVNGFWWKTGIPKRVSNKTNEIRIEQLKPNPPISWKTKNNFKLECWTSKPNKSCYDMSHDRFEATMPSVTFGPPRRNGPMNHWKGVGDLAHQPAWCTEGSKANVASKATKY